MAAVKHKIRCTTCDQSLRVLHEKLGKMIRCPSCAKTFLAALPTESSEHHDKSPTTSQNEEKTFVSGLEPEEGAMSDTCPPEAGKLQSIGRFEIRRQLGEGGFGKVYEAYDPQLARTVAIKVPTFGAENPRRLRRFATEARSAARLHHPNIVAVYENGQTEGGQLYIASEYVAGTTLKSALQVGTASLSQKVTWIRDLAEALAYAHSEGIVHRDIKPENILIDDVHQRAKIVDFGLAKVLDGSTDDIDAPLKTQDGVIGTPAFMAPEQARGEMQNIGPRSDQYSLGAVLYQCLTGEPPFQGSVYMIIAAASGNEEPPSVLSCTIGMPRDLVAICEKAMSKAAENRYADLSEFATDLERWLRDEPVAARQTSPIVRFLRMCRRNPAVSGMTAVTMGILAVSIVVLNITLQHARKEKLNADEHRMLAERASDEATAQAKLATQRAEEARIAQVTATEMQRQAELEKERAQQALDSLRIETSRADSAVSEAASQSQNASKLHDELEAWRIAGEYPHLLRKVKTLGQKGEAAEALTLLRGIPEGVRGWEWAGLQNRLISDSARQIGVPPIGVPPKDKYGNLPRENGIRSPRSHGRAAWHSKRPLLAFAQKGSVRLIDCENPNALAGNITLATDDEEILALSFTGKGDVLCGVSLVGTCFLWETQVGKEIARHTLGKWKKSYPLVAYPVQIQLSRNQPLLFTILGGDVGKYNINTYRFEGNRISGVESIDGLPQPLDELPFLLPDIRNDKYMAIHGWNLLSWDSQSTVRSPQIRRIPFPWDLQYQDDITSISAHHLSVQSGYVYLGAKNGKVAVVDVENQNTLGMTEARGGEITFVHCDPVGQSVATADVDGAVRIWSQPDLQLKKTFLSHSGPVSWVKLSADGQMAVSEAGETLIWKTNGDPYDNTQDIQTVAATLVSDPNMKLRFQDFMRDEKNKSFVVAFEGQLQNTETHKYLAVIPAGLEDNAGTARLYGKNERLAGISLENSAAHVFIATKGKEQLEELCSNSVVPVSLSTMSYVSVHGNDLVFYESGEPRVASLAFEKDGSGHRVVVMNPILDTEIYKSPVTKQIPVQIVASPEGTLMTHPTGAENEVSVVRIATGEIVRKFRTSGRLIGFGPNASYLVASNVNAVQLVSISDAVAGPPIELAGHTLPVTDIKFILEANRVVTSSTDGTVRVWDLSSGIELAEILTLNEGIVALDLTKDNKTLSAMTASGRIATFFVGDAWQTAAQTPP